MNAHARAALPDSALRQLFLDARTHNAWLDRPVDDATLERIVELVRLAPTSANSSPARFVFVKSREAKERLSPHVSSANRAKTMAAPVTAIVAYDLAFYERLDRLFPHNPDAPGWFKGNEASIQETAFRNSSLQGAYLILAARALGLDCGPMSGFDKAGLDATFFPDGALKSNFLCNLGYGDPAALKPRLPRLAFSEMASIL
jgi:3-hydroxypropanoate dehydrogenase